MRLGARETDLVYLVAVEHPGDAVPRYIAVDRSAIVTYLLAYSAWIACRVYARFRGMPFTARMTITRVPREEARRLEAGFQ